MVLKPLFRQFMKVLCLFGLLKNCTCLRHGGVRLADLAGRHFIAVGGARAFLLARRRPAHHAVVVKLGAVLGGSVGPALLQPALRPRLGGHDKLVEPAAATDYKRNKNKFVKLNWLAECEHFRKSTPSNQTELNHTKPNSSIPN